MDKKKVGRQGEDIAVEYLSEKGYEILERNYVYSHGEIDIIARDGEELVFVEVKYRRSLEYGHPAEAISKGKMRLVKRTAEAYLYEKEIENTAARIDVIAVLHYPNSEPEITHFENAF